MRGKLWIVAVLTLLVVACIPLGARAAEPKPRADAEPKAEAEAEPKAEAEAEPKAEAEAEPKAGAEAEAEAEPKAEKEAKPEPKAEAEAKPAEAPPLPTTGDVCIDAFGKSQRLRQQSELRAARRQLLLCGREQCVEVVRKKCVQWLEEIDRDTPSIVVVVIDKQGKSAKDAIVTINGEQSAAALAGRAVPLDPGTHFIRVELSDGASKEEVVTVVQGEKNHRITISFAPKSKDGKGRVTIVRQGSSTNVAAAIAFSVGGAALIAGVITGGLALADGESLEDQCNTEGCTQDEIDSGTSLAHASTATLIIAGVGVALGVTFLFVFDDDAGEARVESAFLNAGAGGLSAGVRF